MNPLFDLSGRTALITGSSQGLGLALARGLAGAGAAIVLNGRDEKKLVAAAEALRVEGARVTTVAFDVTDGAASAAGVAKIEAEFAPIDILINNAGVWGGLATQVFANMDYDNWAYETNIMMMGPFRVLQTFMPNVLASQQKKIVTMTSQVAAHSYKKIIGYSYAAAKAGLNRLVTALAHELADQGLTMILLHPGWIRTDMAGPVADTDPPVAAAENIELINRLTTADNGKFLKWTGEVHEW